MSRRSKREGRRAREKASSRNPVDEVKQSNDQTFHDCTSIDTGNNRENKEHFSDRKGIGLILAEVFGSVIFAAYAQFFATTGHIIASGWCTFGSTAMGLTVIFHAVTLSKPRWRKWLWTSFGILISLIAAVFGAWTLRELSKKPPPNSEPRLSEAELKGVIEASIANLSSGNQSNEITRYPGISAHFIVRLNQPKPNREGFIVDCGNSTESNRFSMFIDRDRNLCFRVIDSGANPLLLRVSEKLETFTFGNLIYLVCEYGTASNFSFLRIAINGRDVNYLTKREPIVMSQELESLDLHFGADLKESNEGRFAMYEAAWYTQTLDRTNSMGLLRYVEGRIATNRTAVMFYGTNSMSRNFPGRGLIQNTNNRAPILRVEPR
jgi:hypothetical protein